MSINPMKICGMKSQDNPFVANRRTYTACITALQPVIGVLISNTKNCQYPVYDDNPTLYFSNKNLVFELFLISLIALPIFQPT